MRTILGVKEVPARVSLSELLSPDLPEGYQTVAGWWATMETAALEMLADPVSTLFDEEEHAITEADKRGLRWKWCSPCDAFRALGFESAKAFPLTFLQQFYPMNP